MLLLHFAKPCSDLRCFIWRNKSLRKSLSCGVQEAGSNLPPPFAGSNLPPPFVCVMQIFTLCAALKPAPVTMNKTMALHVHMSCEKGYTAPHLSRLLQLYIYLEEALDLLVPHHRRCVQDMHCPCKIPCPVEVLIHFPDRMASRLHCLARRTLSAIGRMSWRDVSRTV